MVTSDDGWWLCVASSGRDASAQSAALANHCLLVPLVRGAHLDSQHIFDALFHVLFVNAHFFPLRTVRSHFIQYRTASVFAVS